MLVFIFVLGGGMDEVKVRKIVNICFLFSIEGFEETFNFSLDYFFSGMLYVLVIEVFFLKGIKKIYFRIFFEVFYIIVIFFLIFRI